MECDALFLLTHGRNSLVKRHGLESVERIVVHKLLHHWLIGKEMRHPMHNRSDACFMPIGMMACGCHLPMVSMCLHLYCASFEKESQNIRGQETTGN